MGLFGRKQQQRRMPALPRAAVQDTESFKIPVRVEDESIDELLHLTRELLWVMNDPKFSQETARYALKEATELHVRWTRLAEAGIYTDWSVPFEQGLGRLISGMINAHAAYVKAGIDMIVATAAKHLPENA